MEDLHFLPLNIISLERRERVPRQRPGLAAQVRLLPAGRLRFAGEFFYPVGMLVFITDKHTHKHIHTHTHIEPHTTVEIR